MCSGEELIGARAFRVIFAAISLPLATLALVHFINHRYDGLPLWNLRGQPFVHEAVWILNFVSFFFLYPSTFNLLEVRPPWPCNRLGNALKADTGSRMGSKCHLAYTCVT